MSECAPDTQELCLEATALTGQGEARDKVSLPEAQTETLVHQTQHLPRQIRSGKRCFCSFQPCMGIMVRPICSQSMWSCLRLQVRHVKWAEHLTCTVASLRARWLTVI